jgi:DNA replication ATP-dependent helicase Dna2
MLIDDVLYGLKAELAASSEFEEFVIRRVEQDGSVRKVFLKLADGDGRLDESLEGSEAWWAGPPKGTADVLSVVPEEEQLNLRFVTAPLPGEGHRIRVYPPLYLQRLLEVWERPDNAERFLNWWTTIHSGNRRNPSEKLSPPHLPWLRACQRQAFELPSWRTSFLWGPPGTGKTTTIGAILATFLVDNPAKRVLLLSTTNNAVDQALIKVDQALEEMTQGHAQPSVLRKGCSRIGNHFLARNYQGREHLLPVKDVSLVHALADLETNIPEKATVQAYEKWKAKVEGTRSKMRQQALDALANARLAAMTTTRAVFTYDELAALGPFDLVVFDEASQVGLAHALALVPMGKAAIFAGDPRQLAPIVKSNSADAREWLGRSVFYSMREDDGYTCLLDEQSRMAPDICKVVSNAFYDGKLKVASTCKSDEYWIKERRPFPVMNLGSKNAYLVRTGFESKYSTRYGGHIRYETAELIADLVGDLVSAVGQSDILVLTPYRAQRTLLRAFLKSAGYRAVLVSTVHRAQGSERNTVIFDPVHASTSFLNNRDLGPRLMNVALSRAMARLFVIASRENLLNPVIRQIANILAVDGTASEAQSSLNAASPDTVRIRHGC